jgi:hypothetical protein
MGGADCKPGKTTRSALQPLTSGQRIFRFSPAVERTQQNQKRYPLKRKPGRTRPNSDEAGATPPFDAPCVTASVGSLPPQSRAARDPFSRVPEPEFRSCKTTSITPRKGESKDKAPSPRNTSQGGNLPRFMMSRASKASWTDTPNSVMILGSLTVAPSWLRRFLEKTKLSD